MKQETNKEIDLLLRRMSRQDGGSVRDRETHEQHLDQHLDEDELSSYAQNALPAPARARYTEHLAECSTCRKLVTELILSVGATAAAPVETGAETVAEWGGLRKFLASLFSPMVLRYAVPALGLIVVAVVGFAILRQPKGDGFVAQVDMKQGKAAPLTATPEAPASTSSPHAAAEGKLRTDQSGQIAKPKEATPTSGSISGGVAGAGPAAPAPATTPDRDEKSASAPQPSVAVDEPPPAKSAPSTDSEEQKKKDAIAKKESTPTVAVQAAETPAKTTRANEPVRDYNSAPQTAAERADESKREAAPAQRRGAVDSVSTFGRARGQSGKDDAETRTVSGRRFRKERGIWTDTAYDSSAPITNVNRGSEQFRALVADEPEIKKIAEQLDGEVIVVWKGRAYRIR